jgi:hypothetical protein
MILSRIRWSALAVLTLLPLALVGCATVESVKAEIPKKTPDIDISGIWEAKNWDDARLKQNGAEVSGWIGTFTVQGLVTGKDAYLFLMYGGQAHYTMKLSQTNPGTLDGDWFYKLATPKDMAFDSGVIRKIVLWRKVRDLPPN